MRIFGLPVPFTGERKKALHSVDPGQGGWFRIMEPWAGAWQHNVSVDYDSVLSNHADFSCKTLISSDIAKLRIKLVASGERGIWQETTNPAYSPVLRKPNHFQTRIQFFETWVISKLQRGNTYVLKQRDGRGVVVRLYVLDASRVRPMIADNGDVFYELQTDKLSGLDQTRLLVPAREIIHDRFNCLFHPLIGVSPIFAAGLAATHGLAIQEQATKFFTNGARPGGILTAPGSISTETALRLKEYFETNFSGKNAGKVAVVGDGLKYDPMAAKSSDSQLIEQLKWTAEQVCGVYHVPAFMVGVGQEPNYNNVQNLTLRYYSQCLQVLIESIEICLDEGLGMGESIGTEFDLDGLLRMDSLAQMEVLEKSKGKLTPNEQRKRLELPPVTGGDTVFMQEQDHSLEWLARRDAQPIEAPAPEPAPEERAAMMRDTLRKELGLAA
jgi:HK97 family phage portal protein